MKLFNLKLLILFSLLLCPISIWADESKPAAESTTSGASAVGANAKPITFAAVSRSTAEALCKKMEECATEKIPFQECLIETQRAFLEAYEALPKNKQFKLTQTQNTACVEVILKSSCQSLQSASQLPGCEYIQKLN